ncbi:MAG: GAF domain-containing protein [Xenococcaceae cyanobacterium MO_188.B29]|nr:GAF domain-containing protein [Xenococcaceae cyanobacterium MO_188.B29]
MSDLGLQKVFNRLADNLAKDALVQTVVTNLRNDLQVDRVVLYYFYSQWQGQVTFESLSSNKFSIFGSTGPDDCFNGEYAAMYQQGRVRAIEDIETEPINDCHRDFLRNLQVRANLVVPVLPPKGLWGLLIAHQCLTPRIWTPTDIAAMEKGANILVKATTICQS